MPATPTFTIVDNADGTATVTIAGSTGGSTNTVYGMSIDDQFGIATSWTSYGSRTGDGTVLASTRQGIFFFIVSSALSGSTVYAAPSAPRQITNTARPVVQNAILNVVQSRIRTLNLIPSERVFVHTVVDETKLRDLKGGPAIIVGPADESMTAFEDSHSVVQRDDLGYPVVVAYVAPRNDQPVTESKASEIRDAFYLPTQSIRRAFIEQALPVSGATVFQCKVRPMRPAERTWWERLVFCSGQILSFRSREPRGIGQ